MARYKFPAGKPAAPGKLTRAPDQCITTMEKDFPRVLQAIQAMWGYQELNVYFRKLMMDQRGDREGFPKEVWEDLYLLEHMHHEIVPETFF